MHETLAIYSFTVKLKRIPHGIQTKHHRLSNRKRIICTTRQTGSAALNRVLEPRRYVLRGAPRWHNACISSAHLETPICVQVLLRCVKRQSIIYTLLRTS